MNRALIVLLLGAATLLPQARAQSPIRLPGAAPAPRPDQPLIIVDGQVINSDAPAAGPGDDPLAKLFFSPELVLRYAAELGLLPEQRSTIVNAIKEAQGDLFDLQMQMLERSQELMKALGDPGAERNQETRKLIATQKVDESAVLARVDRVLAVEREMKRRQMQLLIRIRNALTPEQQERLALYRDRPGAYRQEQQ